MKLKLQYLERNGDRLFVRIGGRGQRRRIRIREAFGTPGFMAAYEAAIAELLRGQGEAKAGISPNSLRWLAGRYFASPEFRGLDLKSQGVRKQVIESCLLEPLQAGGKLLMADCPIAKFGPKHVRLLRDRRAKQPGAANNRRKYLSSMFGWAIENEPDLVERNPCREVAKVTYESDGFKVWSEADLERFEHAYPVGTKERLALALLLFIGARRSDIVRLGPACVRDGLIRFVPVKTKRYRRDPTPKPMLPELARVIAATKLQGKDTWLVTNFGRPFSAAGFGNFFGDACRKIGLSDCTAHGLRKLGATRAAMAGATHFQLMSIFDWSRPAQAQPYIDQAERARAAAAGMNLLSQRG